MNNYKRFPVIWSKSYVDTFSSFHVTERRKKILRYICIDVYNIRLYLTKQVSI